MGEYLGFWTFFIENSNELLEQLGEHIKLTVISLLTATVFGVSLGLLLYCTRALAKPVLGVINILQTIPSLALLGFLIPLLGIGEEPAIIALFLYALLPIVRNTYTGLVGVDDSIKEAARGMGFSSWQQLVQIDLPLALPVIFAGIRTSAVINVGVATLCALIAAGGLGEFIFRGIALNNSQMIMLGAIPAALLALAFDGLLGIIQRNIHKSRRWLPGVMIAASLLVGMISLWPSSTDTRWVAGFPSEFVHRGDGYVGLRQHYKGMDFAIRELDIALMYQAVKSGEVDVISGFSTDGRIQAYDLISLVDDKGYFPPYHCAPLASQAMLNQYPEVTLAMQMLADAIDDDEMVAMNYLVDEQQLSLDSVANWWLSEHGLPFQKVRQTENPQIRIGSKNFTENLLLATLFEKHLENQTSLDVTLSLGFGGTQLIYEALLAQEIDLYPEYTGTGLLVLLKASGIVRDSLGASKESTYRYVQQKMTTLGVKWLSPLGFNNTFALMMRKDLADKFHITTVSELVSAQKE